MVNGLEKSRQNQAVVRQARGTEWYRGRRIPVTDVARRCVNRSLAGRVAMSPPLLLSGEGKCYKRAGGSARSTLHQFNRRAQGEDADAPTSFLDVRDRHFGGSRDGP